MDGWKGTRGCCVIYEKATKQLKEPSATEVWRGRENKREKEVERAHTQTAKIKMEWEYINQNHFFFKYLSINQLVTLIT